MSEILCFSCMYVPLAHVIFSIYYVKSRHDAVLCCPQALNLMFQFQRYKFHISLTGIILSLHENTMYMKHIINILSVMIPQPIITLEVYSPVMLLLFPLPLHLASSHLISTCNNFFFDRPSAVRESLGNDVVTWARLCVFFFAQMRDY